MAVYKNGNKLWSIRGTCKNAGGEYIPYKKFSGSAFINFISLSLYKK